jgi:protein TonB
VVHSVVGLLHRTARDKGVLAATLVASLAVHASAVSLAQLRRREPPREAAQALVVEVIDMPSVEVEPPPTPTPPLRVSAPRPKPHARSEPPAAPPPAPEPAAPEPPPAVAPDPQPPAAGPAVSAGAEPGTAGCAGGVCLPVGQGGTGKVGASGMPGPGNLGVPRAPTPAGGNAAPVPLVRAQAAYPDRARDEEIEGWVLVRFTIAADGSVTEPEVVEASPRRIFDRAALDAIRRWKYRPMLQDGRAVARPGVSVKLTFKLE